MRNRYLDNAVVAFFRGLGYGLARALLKGIGLR